MAETDYMPRQHAPRYRLTHPGPGYKCVCGHREGTHNDLSYCLVFNCGCEEAGGFSRAVPESNGYGSTEGEPRE